MIGRKNIPLILLLSFFTLAFVANLFAPKPIDWSETFSKTDKIPYGTFVTFETIGKLFDGEPEAVYEPIYNRYYNNLLGWSATKQELSTMDLTYERLYETHSYILINDEFEVDKLDTRALLDFVSGGNHAFLAARRFGGPLADTLKLRTGIRLLQYQDEMQDSVVYNFTNKQLASDEPYWHKRGFLWALSSYDTTNATVLARLGDGTPSLIRHPHGSGTIIISTQPEAFTNYNLVNPKQRGFASKAFSYLPKESVLLWDEYYKVGRLESQTPMRFLLQNSYLRYALYLLVAALLLMVYFTAKRRQRAIPIVEPPQNTSLAFADTIGRLYLERRDHKDLATKKITYFKAFLHTDLRMSNDVYDPNLVDRLCAKTGSNFDDTKKLVYTIRQVEKSQQLSSEDLLQLSELFETFYAVASKRYEVGATKLID